MKKIQEGCFYWHPIAPNNNLTCGGDPKTPGWIEIVASSYDEALQKLAKIKPEEVDKIWDHVYAYAEEQALDLENLDYEECATSECWGGHPSQLLDYDNVSGLCCEWNTYELNVELTI